MKKNIRGLLGIIPFVIVIAVAVLFVEQYNNSNKETELEDKEPGEVREVIGFYTPDIYFSQLVEEAEDLQDQSYVIDDEPAEIIAPADIEELGYRKATRLSGWVLGEECFTDNEALLEEVIGIVSRLTPNNMTGAPRGENGEMISGGSVTLNLYDENGLLYEVTSCAGEPKVMYISGSGYEFFCDLSEEDNKLFLDISSSIYYEFAPEELEN